MALTSLGKVYAWGDNSVGQLGVNDTQTRYEPVFVDELRPYTVTQILAVDSMSYALTSHGVVYAWGDNKNGTLALEHDNPRVLKPEPMMRMKETPVMKLAVKECGGSSSTRGKTVIAFVDMADALEAKDLIGGFDRPLGEMKEITREQVLSDKVEKDIFEGVDLMRRIMDNTQDWWTHLLEVRHGSPYDDHPEHVDDLADKQVEGDNCTVLQLDTFVGLDMLEKASYELDMLIQSAKDQLLEIRTKKGTKNVKFMLSLFMDDCKLRREKIRRTVAARQLMDHKRGLDLYELPDLLSAGNPDQVLRQTVSKLSHHSKRVRDLKTYDIFTKAFQDSLVETLECKLQLLQTQAECLKATDGAQANPAIPALKIIKERWSDLKRFSIYNLYQECNQRGQGVSFSSDDEMLAFLVQSSDAKIDQIIQVDRDQLVSRDPLIPGLCYDLLVENAELRKMCNTYQLKVLLLKEGKHKPGGHQLALTR